MYQFVKEWDSDGDRILFKGDQAQYRNKDHPACKANTIPVIVKHPPIPCNLLHSIVMLPQKGHLALS